MSKQLQPGSPRIEGDGENKEYTYVYKCDKGTGSSYVPARHSTGPEGKGYFIKWTCTSEIGWDTLSLTYAADIPETGANSIKDGKTQSSIETSVMEKDLIEHSKYKYNWDHYLVAEKDSDITVDDAKTEANWTEAVNDTIVNGTDGLKWVHKSERVPTGHKKLTDVQKPKVEAFYYPAAIITEKYYFRKKSKAEEKIGDIGKIGTPEDTHRVTAQWFIIACNVYEDGKYWVCEMKFQGAREWDADLYTEAE